jgi:hypothetical protein
MIIDDAHTAQVIFDGETPNAEFGNWLGTVYMTSSNAKPSISPSASVNLDMGQETH